MGSCALSAQDSCSMLSSEIAKRNFPLKDCLWLSTYLTCIYFSFHESSAQHPRSYQAVIHFLSVTHIGAYGFHPGLPEFILCRPYYVCTNKQKIMCFSNMIVPLIQTRDKLCISSSQSTKYFMYIGLY